MKNVCVYKGQPLKIKPILETLKEQGIPYQVKSKFTLRAVHEWGLNISARWRTWGFLCRNPMNRKSVKCCGSF